MALAHWTSTPINEIESMSIVRFNAYYGQLAWLRAIIRSDLGAVAQLAIGDEKYNKGFFDAIKQTFDPRTEQERWKDDEQKLRRLFNG